MQRTLIVGGCPRSGTTALVRLLNCHPRVLIGDERYYWLFERGGLDERLFEPARFFDLREADRHWEEGREPLPEGAGQAVFADAAWVGDKYPPLWRAYGEIGACLPDARVVHVLRNPLSVAQSYEARADDASDAWHFGTARAIEDWNASVRGTLDAVARGLDVLVVSYEAVFAPGADMQILFGALGLSAAPALAACGAVTAKAARVFRQDTPRDEALRREVCLGADLDAYRALSARCLFAGG